MTIAAEPRKSGDGNTGGMSVIPPYEHAEVESAAQRRWDERGIFAASDETERPKYFCGSMFTTLAGPIHLGHCRNYVLGDVMARLQRMRGHEVLQSVGWEACGLRVRLAAEEAGMPPAQWARAARDKGRKVLRRLGLAMDWSRELTTDVPAHQELQQQLFLRLWKAQPSLVKPERQPGVAYWDASTKSFVSPRQLVNGRGPESGMLAEVREVETYELEVAAATAERLLEGLESLPRWDSFVKNMQRESIGMEEGLTVTFDVHGPGDSRLRPLKVFTSRPDTVMGTTYLAVGVKHELALLACETAPDVRYFCEMVNNPRYAYRKLGEDKRQEGMPLGVYAVNPINGDHVPVWVTNYVVAGYGTGATLGVPGHDQRNYNFALRHNLPLRRVAIDDISDLSTPLATPYVGKRGVVVNSAGLEESLNPLKEQLAAKANGGAEDSLERKRLWDQAVNDCVMEFLNDHGVPAERDTVARLRGWKVSQDEYWGCPVPLVHCPSCGTVTVPMDELPVLLPDYERGKDSLSDYPSFVERDCPECGGKARRDTDTLAELFDASWNYYRQACRDESQALAGNADAWLPVDFYCCGVELATTHLLCSRIMHRYMLSLGLLPKGAGPEPFESLMCPGPVLNYGLPMATWYGNAIEPDRLIDECGADLLRLLLATNVDPRHPMHWDDAKLFLLQGVLTPAELRLFRNGNLTGIKADLASRTLSERERKRISAGLLDKEGFARMRSGSLDKDTMAKVKKILRKSDIRRLRHGILDETGLKSLRKGVLDPNKMVQVRNVLSEIEVLRLQRGLLDMQQLRQLMAGSLPEKVLAKARSIAGDAVIARMRESGVDVDEPGAIAGLQEKFLDSIEEQALAREKEELGLLRKARGVLADGEIGRLRSGLLDKEQFAALRDGSLEDGLMEQVRGVVGVHGIARLQDGLLDMEAMERLYTGEMEAKERKAVEKVIGEEALASLDKAVLPRKKIESLKRALGGLPRLERLRKGMLGAEKTAQAIKVIGKRKLSVFQAAALDDDAYERLAGFVETGKMDALVSFLDPGSQAALDAVLDKDEQAMLAKTGLGYRARPLLRVLDEGRMDEILDFVDDERMDVLVNFLESDRMEQLLGFLGNLWGVVASKAGLVLASESKPKGDSRRAMLHHCLKSIDASYIKSAKERDHSKQGNRDLELSKVIARARELVALLDTAASIDAEADREFAAECSSILLAVLHPILPHVTEELWALLGFEGLLCDAPWPKVDVDAINLGGVDTFVVQVDGRKRLSFVADGPLKDSAAKSRALKELGQHSWERGHPGFPGKGEEVVDVELARRDSGYVVNFVTYKSR